MQVKRAGLLAVAVATCVGLAGCPSPGQGDGGIPDSGSGTDAILAVAPINNDFGMIATGASSANVSFTVSNLGGATSGPIQSSVVGSSDFTTVIDGCTGTLAPGVSCSVVLNFSPTSSGSKSATLTISGAPGGTVQATLTGTGTGGSALSITPNLQNFGSVMVNTTSTPMTFTVTNSGTVSSGTLTPALSGTDGSSFTLVTSTCAAALAPAASCTLTVRFDPTSTGAKTAKVTVTGSAGGSASADLNGTGQSAGQVTLSPSPHGFGPALVNTPTADVVFTASNTSATATGALALALTGTDPTQFTLSTAGTCVTGTTVLTPMGTTGSSCTILVRFNPTSSGPKAATLSVTPAGASATTAALSGTGQTPAQLTISPTTQPFGMVALGTSSSNVTFTVTNTGGVATPALSNAFSGTSASQFAIVSGDCAGVLLAAATSCTIVVRFTPTTSTAGTASLDVTTTVSTLNASATLTGQGFTPATLTLSPLLHPYADTQVGSTSTSQTFTVTNTGTVPTGALTTAKAGTNPADFTIGADACQGATLIGGATCTIDVSFAPASASSRSATLTVSGSPGGTTPSATLTGTGLSPASLTLTPTALTDFGSVGLGASSGNTLYTVTNTGQTVSGPVNVVLSGTSASDFILSPSTPCGATLAANATCTFNVNFSPTSLGLKNASIDVSASPGGSKSSPLQGTGIAAAAVSTTTPLAFGDVTVGQFKELTLTVSNGGAAPSGKILALPITGANASEYSVVAPVGTDCVPNTTVLTASASCTVVVRFTPTSAVGITNPKTATLTVTLENGTGGVPTTALNGNARALVTISSPGIFNDARIGLLPALRQVLTFTVTNNATAGGPSSGNLAIDPLGAPNANQFALCNGTTCNGAAAGTCALAGTTSLAAGVSCTLKVEFQPTAGGTQSSTLSVAGTASTSNPSVALTGNGTVALTISPLDAAPPAPPSSFSYGPALIGTSAVQTFTVSNGSGVGNTTDTIRYSLSNNAGGSFAISGGTCGLGTALSPPPASCTIIVTFFPRLPAAVKSATLDVSGSPGNVLAVALSGTALTGASVTVTTAGSFGSPQIGSSAVAVTYTITNTGQTAISAGGLGFGLTGPNAAEFAINPAGGGTPCGSASLAPAGTCTITVSYTAASPAAPPAHNAILTVTGGGSTATAPLTATPVSPLSVSPGTFGFGPVRNNTASTPQVFTVTNNSAGTLSGITINGATANWVFSGSTCTGTLTTGASCSITVTFNPTAAGLQTRNLDFVSSSPVVVTGTAVMTGTGMNPASLTITPLNPSFGTLTVGQFSDYLTFTVTNTAPPGSLATGALATFITGDYTISGATNTCSGTSLTVGGSPCTLQIRFSATSSLGARFGTLTVSGLNLAAAATDTLSGFTIAPTPLVLDHSVQDYGKVAVGSTSDFTFTLRNNNGTVAATGLAITAGGAYSIPTNNCGATLGPNLICTVIVRYTPTGSGQQQGTLTVTSTNNATVTASLLGRAQSPAALTVTLTSGSSNFGPTTISFNGSAATFTVQNVGDVTSTSINAVVGGSDPSHFFTINNCTTLASGQTCTVVANFAPTTLGPKVATLSIGGPPAINLTGTGVGLPMISVSPSSGFSFSAIPVGTQSATVVTYTVSIGTQTGRTGVLTFAVTNSPNFTILAPASGDCISGTTQLGPTGAAGASCTIRVTFTPTVAQPLVGVLNITAAAASGGGGTVQISPLTGNGISAHSIAPTAFTYANTVVGGFGAVQSFTVTQLAGTPTSNPLVVGLTGAASDFIITADTCSGTQLAASQTCTVSVRFTPTAPAATRNATLTVTNSGTPNVAASTLTGTGT